MKTANLFIAGLAGLVLAACAGTNARLESEREYVHQLRAPTKPYNIEKKFDSENNLFYLETTQDNGLITGFYLDKGGKIERVAMRTISQFNQRTEITGYGEEGYFAQAYDEQDNLVCIDNRCSTKSDVSRLQSFVNSYTGRNR